MTMYAWPVMIAPLGTTDVDLDGVWVRAYAVREGEAPVPLDQGWVAQCRTCQWGTDLWAVHADKIDARHWFAWHAVIAGHTRMMPIKVQVRS